MNIPQKKQRKSRPKVSMQGWPCSFAHRNSAAHCAWPADPLVLSPQVCRKLPVHLHLTNAAVECRGDGFGLASATKTACSGLWKASSFFISLIPLRYSFFVLFCCFSVEQLVWAEWESLERWVLLLWDAFYYFVELCWLQHFAPKELSLPNAIQIHALFTS